MYNDSTDKTVEYSNGSDIAFNRSSMNLNKSEEKGYKLSDGGVYYNKSIIVLGDLKIIDKESENINFSDIQVIDNKYYYNKEDKSIYKWDGTKVKEITSGNGLNNIENINEKYYVKSGTGYYYTMDENFEQTSEPFKIESEKSLRTLSTTNVGGQLHDEFINKNTGESLKIYK